MSMLGIVLIASLMAIAWWGPASMRFAGGAPGIDGAMGHLIAEVGSHRFSEARLIEPFAWGNAPSADRDRRRSLPASTRIAALQLVELSSRSSGASAARSLGVAYLALDQVDKAIGAFEQAVELDPEDTRSHADLAAALIRRWRAGGHALSAIRALEETGFVLAKQPQSPEATFNQAMILEYLGARVRQRTPLSQGLRLSHPQETPRRTRRISAERSLGGLPASGRRGRDRPLGRLAIIQ